MAKNDIVLLDGILAQRVKDGLPSGQLDEVFEYFAFEQILKDYDLSREELDSGWVDGKDDGGIDGFFTIVNGHLLTDPEAFLWPKRNAELEVWIVTSKHHATFLQAPLNSLLASLPELMDLSLEAEDFKGHYSEALLAARSLLHLAYRRLSFARPTVSFRFYYVSRGDAAMVAENILARASQIISLASSLFSSCDANFAFIGATELIDFHRRTKRFSLELPFLEHLARASGGYVLLVGIREYKQFVTDEENRLRRYLFDSNVRDYLGENRVNEDIANSLRDSNAPDFWWLNNGISILTTAATVLGKTIQLQDVLIVNGLQTTETIFRHFEQNPNDTSSRAVLVRVVVSTDASVRDQIIRANNNQSVVELASLHATDRIQRDIEDVLERHGWFYERRKNYFRNIGKPPARFVTPMYLAAGYVSLVMKNPAVAARLKMRVLRNSESYGAIFSTEAPLEVWPAITEVLKRTEDGLVLIRPDLQGSGERFLANWRSLIGFLALSRLIGRFSYSSDELIKADFSRLTPDYIKEVWKLTQSIDPLVKRPYRAASFVTQCCRALAEAYGTSTPQAVAKKAIPVGSGSHLKAKATISSEEFLNLVDAALPKQPWKPRVHIEVANKIGYHRTLVSDAIQELIESGRRNRQKDGVVYDKDGNIVAKDQDRIGDGSAGT